MPSKKLTIRNTTSQKDSPVQSQNGSIVIKNSQEKPLSINADDELPSMKYNEIRQLASADEILGVIKPNQPHFYMFVGSSRAGKTFCCKYILSSLAAMGHLDNIFVFSRTAFRNPFEHLGIHHIYEGFDDEILNGIIEIIKENYHKTGTIRPIAIVLDDMGGSKELSKNVSTFANLLLTYRHFGINLFVMVQYAYLVGPRARAQADHVFMYKYKNEKNLDALYHSYGSGFADKKEFKQVMDEINQEPYKALVYRESYKPIDEYVIYKAPSKRLDISFDFQQPKKYKRKSTKK